MVALLPSLGLDELALVRWHDGADKQVDELADRHASGVGRPGGDGGEQPGEVELAQNRLVLVRHALGRQDKAVQQRRQDLLQANAKRRVSVRTHQLRHVCVVALGKLKNQAHVVREIQGLLTHEPLVDQAPDIVQNLLFDLLEQVVYISVVQVEGGAVVAGAVGDLAHGYLASGLLPVQAPKRRAQVGARLLGHGWLLLHVSPLYAGLGGRADGLSRRAAARFHPLDNPRRAVEWMAPCCLPSTILNN